MGRPFKSLTTLPLVGWAALVAGLASAVVLHATEKHLVPIYDGIPLPAPYRYVSPPPDLASTNQPPLSGEASIQVQNGQIIGEGVQTGDGQLAVFVQDNGIQVSSGARSVLVKLEPITNPPAAPTGLQIRGNVYRISAVEQPSGATVVPTKPLQVTIQAPPGPLTKLELYDGITWHPIDTNYASDQFPTANLSMFGELAAVAPPSPAAVATPSLAGGAGATAAGFSSPVIVLGLAVVGLGIPLCVAAALLWRRRVASPKLTDAPTDEPPRRKVPGQVPPRPPRRRKRPRR